MIKKILILLLTLIPFAGLGPVAADIAASTVNAETTADIYITYFPLVFKEEPIDYDRPLEYGLNFISSAEAPSNNDRYNKAISAGATWNRWPLYWQKVEKSDGVFNWSYADSVVAADLAKGFQTEIILMGTPSFYATGGRADVPAPQVGQHLEDWQNLDRENWIASTTSSTPTGLNEKIFIKNDGSKTDTPGSGRSINPDNKWARFVYGAVDHYSARGITYFEIWNEPDFNLFWSGTVADYARLLKVGYLAAEQANPNVKIIFGGLANDYNNLDFFDQVLDIIENDSKANTYNWFFDIMATHSYSDSWKSYFHIYRAGLRMDEHGIDKPIWLNESGVPAWDDYPGPTWDRNSPYRATKKEMASYIIQSALYARFVDAEVIFHFQLYDDCGNDPAGTDFPPNRPDLCDPEKGILCAGDAYGLFSNPTDAACYRQHPNPNTARPAYTAYQVLTQYLNNLTPLKRERKTGASSDWQQEWIYFTRPESGEQVLAIWSRYGETETAKVPAIGNKATLIDQYGNVTTLTPNNKGKYVLELEKATNRNSYSEPYNYYAIGGPPLILIEKDTRAPEITITETHVDQEGAITISWQGDDPGLGIKDYDVWVSVDGGEMVKWLEHTTATRIKIAGNAGSIYGFAIVGRDPAGNENALPTEPAIIVDITDFMPD